MTTLDLEISRQRADIDLKLLHLTQERIADDLLRALKLLGVSASGHLHKDRNGPDNCATFVLPGCHSIGVTEAGSSPVASTFPHWSGSVGQLAQTNPVPVKSGMTSPGREANPNFDVKQVFPKGRWT